jgi:pyruvate dehydrogenase E2 component (dihydrolipoamide acetyltransferase)
MEAAASAKGEGDVEPLTRAQRQVARRVAESRATVPAFVVSVDADVEGIDGATLGARVVRACALALREHPRANASYRGDGVELHAHVNIGVVIATPDAPVLATVFDASDKDAPAIAAELETLAAAARDGSITPPQLSGATFTVGDLSVAGAAVVEPIVLPPQVAALTIGAVEARAAVRDGEVVARRAVTLSLAVDGRVLSADAAAALLARVRALVVR